MIDLRRIYRELDAEYDAIAAGGRDTQLAGGRDNAEFPCTAAMAAVEMLAQAYGIDVRAS